MLTVRQVATATESELNYECWNDKELVGRLNAHAHPDGAMMVRPIEAQQNEAARSLLAAFERDAVTKRVPAIYLECRDDVEKARYMPAGYTEWAGGSNVLFKKIPLIV